MKHLRDFILSAGGRYQELQLASADISTRAGANPRDDGLDGWAFMMRTPGRDLAFVYLEHDAGRPSLRGFVGGARYRWTWFDPRTGHWALPVELAAAADGTLETPPPAFDRDLEMGDWAAQVRLIP